MTDATVVSPTTIRAPDLHLLGSINLLKKHCYRSIIAVGIGSLILPTGALARDGSQATPEMRVLTATTMVRVSEDSEERQPASFTLRVPAVCVEDFRPGPKKGVIWLKPFVGTQTCVFTPEQTDLIDITKGRAISFHAAQASFADRRRASHLRFHTHLVETEFGLERRMWPHAPINRHLSGTNPYSPIVFIERERTTSLVDIWCYPKAQDHFLCPFHMHPRPNLAIETQIRFRDRHRWRELTEAIEQFIARSLH